MDNTNFNPEGPNIHNGAYFGFPVDPAEANLILLSAPWEVTTSYGGGTSGAPEAIVDASMQLDLYDIHYPGGWEKGIGTLPINKKIYTESERLRHDAQKVIAHLDAGGSTEDTSVRTHIEKVNTGSEWLNEYIYTESAAWLQRGKVVAVIGGDHSTPYGLIRALAEVNPGMGILHIDAHSDMRNAYEGFTYSHASIMYNVMTRLEGIAGLTQVSLRDFSDSELHFCRADERITMFSDHHLSEDRFHGESWSTICRKIIDTLPENVYISFDIDGLSPDNCPNTGTPVPGGLSFNEAVYLISQLTESGRRIVGFDLCEVSPALHNEWDANVGARILYKLCNLTLKSNNI